MSEKLSKSTNRDDYEILIRKRGESDYASYCPQLNILLKGKEHEQVQNEMDEYIRRHIDTLDIETEKNDEQYEEE